MEEKFAVTLTEDQFTPRNLEGQLHVPEKRGPGYPLCGPHGRSKHEGAVKMSTPAENHFTDDIYPVPRSTVTTKQTDSSPITCPYGKR